MIGILDELDEAALVVRLGAEQGLYLPMDVELTLPTFMVEGLPDRARYVLLDRVGALLSPSF